MSEPEVEGPLGDVESSDEELKWPWGFITIIVLAALYLVWRFVQLGARLFGYDL